MAQKAPDRQLSHREIWASKPALREVYGHLYRGIAAACQPGLTIEVGGGSGSFKQFAPDVLSFDIVHEPWLDFVADAQALPLQIREALRTSSCWMSFITSSIRSDSSRMRPARCSPVAG